MLLLLLHRVPLLRRMLPLLMQLQACLVRSLLLLLLLVHLLLLLLLPPMIIHSACHGGRHAGEPWGC